MPKSDYDRYSLQENQLKKILIRVDYSGVTQIENWVENIKTSFIKNIFGNYFKRINNNATLDLSNLTEIAKKQSIPISEIIKEPVHTSTGYHRIFRLSRKNKFKYPCPISSFCTH